MHGESRELSYMSCFETPLTTPPLRPFKSHGIVDENAITLRIRPLRWRDRALFDVRRFAGAAATVAVVAGGLLFFAAPSEAARIQPNGTAEPMMAPMTKVAPALAKARFEADPAASQAPGSLEGEEEEDEVIIIIEDEDEDDEVLIFDDSLDAPSAAAMAQFHIEQSEHGLALQYALEAVEAEPRNAAHQSLLGKAYRLNGDRRAARKALRRARRLRR